MSVPSSKRLATCIGLTGSAKNSQSAAGTCDGGLQSRQRVVLQLFFNFRSGLLFQYPHVLCFTPGCDMSGDPLDLLQSNGFFRWTVFLTVMPAFSFLASTWCVFSITEQPF